MLSDDQEDETICQSGQASFLLVVVRQIREAATLILDCNPMNALRMAEIIDIEATASMEVGHIVVTVLN